MLSERRLYAIAVDGLRPSYVRGDDLDDAIRRWVADADRSFMASRAASIRMIPQEIVWHVTARECGPATHMIVRPYPGGIDVDAPGPTWTEDTDDD